MLFIHLHNHLDLAVYLELRNICEITVFKLVGKNLPDFLSMHERQGKGVGSFFYC